MRRVPVPAAALLGTVALTQWFQNAGISQRLLALVWVVCGLVVATEAIGLQRIRKWRIEKQIAYAAVVVLLTGLGMVGMRRDAPGDRTDLVITCKGAFLPTKTSADFSVNVLDLWPLPAANGGGGLGRVLVGGDGPMSWPTDGPRPLSAYKCELTNYGSEVVLNVRFSLDLTFKEAIVQPNESGGIQSTSGGITLARDWPIQIDKLDPGVDRSFTFYVYNWHKYYVFVNLPDVATVEVRSAGLSTPPKSVRVLHPHNEGMPDMLLQAAVE